MAVRRAHAVEAAGCVTKVAAVLRCIIGAVGACRCRGAARRVLLFEPALKRVNDLGCGLLALHLDTVLLL
jgi:hypothetical protein